MHATCSYRSVPIYSPGLKTPPLGRISGINGHIIGYALADRTVQPEKVNLV